MATLKKYLGTLKSVATPSLRSAVLIHLSVAQPTNAYVCHLIKSLLFKLIKSFLVSYFNTWFDLLVLTPVIWSKVLYLGRSNLSILINWFDLLTHAFVTWLKVLFLSWSNLSFFLFWSSDLIYWNWHWSFDQNSSCPVDQIFRSFFFD